MSVNFSQNPHNQNIQDNFGAGFPQTEAPVQFDMLKSMGLPSNGDEFIKFSPYFATALGASKLVSHAALVASRLNPKKNPATMTVADSFNNSKLGKLATSIDNRLLPIIEKHSDTINSTTGKIKKFTPKWVKNLIEQIKIGVMPKNRAALGQYKGMTNMAAESLIGAVRELPLEKQAELGLNKVLELVNSKKMTAANAVTEISKLLKDVSAQELQSMKSASGKSLKLLNELNKSKAFVAANAKTTISKGIQKGFMAVSEAAGGGVVGGGLFGIVMNSLFLASTFKRTWDAPWGEKLSTFMEGALVEFCGGYLMALLGTRITYKLLGIKNLDKTPLQTLRNKKLYDEIIQNKKNYKEVNKLIKIFEKGPASESIFSKLNRKFLTKETFEENALRRMKALITKIPAYKNKTVSYADAPEILMKLQSKYPNQINRAIDRFAKTKKLQNNGFLKNLINRPIRWVANFFSVGLESIPAKIADGKNVSHLRSFLQKSKNCFKGILGYPVRFLLVLMVVTPPLTKLCAKVSHTLFGKPSKSIMDDREENKDNASSQNQTQNPYHVDMDTFSQYTKLSGLAKAQAEAQQGIRTDYSNQISQTMINDAINAQKSRVQTIANDDISPATYVPNPQGSNFSNPEISDYLNEKLKFADSIGQYVQKELEASRKSMASKY